MHLLHRPFSWRHLRRLSLPSLSSCALFTVIRVASQYSRAVTCSGHGNPTSTGGCTVSACVLLVVDLWRSVIWVSADPRVRSARLTTTIFRRAHVRCVSVASVSFRVQIVSLARRVWTMDPVRLRADASALRISQAPSVFFVPLSVHLCCFF